MIVIVDYGMGNVRSIQNMLKKLGHQSVISSDRGTIIEADRLIIPGVGAFDAAMRNMKDLDLLDVLNTKALEEKVPVLGICLAMQLFTRKSEEGELSGLGWIPGETIRFNFKDLRKPLRVPHMGWNTITTKKQGRMFRDTSEEQRFYFVHSFHLVCDYERDIACTTDYGYEFVSAVEHENIFGVQFHPEKSHKYGMKILNNFARAV